MGVQLPLKNMLTCSIRSERPRERKVKMIFTALFFVVLTFISLLEAVNLEPLTITLQNEANTAARAASVICGRKLNPVKTSMPEALH